MTRVLLGLLFAACFAVSARAADVGPLSIAKQGYFFVGGKYVQTKNGPIMAGQAYVEFQIPVQRTHPFPIVMIEGCCSAGSAFMGTPDGRDGWAQYFLKRGYAVYIMDQVGRGRSPFIESVYGKKSPKALAPAYIEREFLSYEHFNLYPQAHLHTQWPGTGKPGDPIFDQFQAEMMYDFDDRTLRETLNRDAGLALLAKIGPSIVLPHSQAGIYAFGMADAKPELVKALLMVESAGPVFHDLQFTGAPGWFKDGDLSKPYGLTRTPLTYAPKPAKPTDIAIEKQAKADAPDLAPCWVQKEPARQLPKLKGIPILILNAEASFQIPAAHCTAKLLKQAGVDNDFIRLADVGIHGNGHFVMLEKNNLDVAGVIANWLDKRVTPLEAKGKIAAH